MAGREPQWLNSIHIEQTSYYLAGIDQTKDPGMADEPTQPYDKNNEEAGHREQRIRELAYQMWEAEGRPEGRAEHYWNRAQELIEDESQSAYPPAASRGDRD